MNGFVPRAMGARVHEATTALAQVLADMAARRESDRRGEPPPAGRANVLNLHIAAAAEMRGRMRTSLSGGTLPVSGYDFQSLDPRVGAAVAGVLGDLRETHIRIIANALADVRGREPGGPREIADAGTIHDAMLERGYAVVQRKD